MKTSIVSIKEMFGLKEIKLDTGYVFVSENKEEFKPGDVVNVSEFMGCVMVKKHTNSN